MAHPFSLEGRKARLVDSLSNFHQNDELSDCKIRCGTRQWKVHKLVLAMHSNVLQKAFTSGFRVGIGAAIGRAGG